MRLVLSARLHWLRIFLASVAWCISTPSVSADDAARMSLRSLADTYADVRLTAVDMVSGAPSHIQLMRIVSHRNGDVAARYWPTGTAWKDLGPTEPKPDYFVFSNGKTLYSMRSTSPGYTSFQYDLQLENPSTLNIHHFLAPWPYVSGWVRQLLDADDAVFSRDAGVLTASSESIGLSLSWNERFSVVRIARTRSDGGVSAMSFDSFDSRTTPSFPMSARLHTMASTATGAPSHESMYAYERVRLNDPRDEALLPFDEVALGVYRYDATTGDVYNHDGTLLYNEKAFLKQAGIPVAGTEIAVYWYTAIVVAGVLSAWAARRRIVSGRLKGLGESWLGHVSAGARILVGLFFLLAVVAKLSTVVYVGGLSARGAAALTGVIRQHEVIPSGLAPAAAYGAIGLELALGMMLLTHRRVRPVCGAATGFLAVMSVYLVIVWIMRGNVSCGCLGQLTKDQLSSSLVRNAVAAGLLVPSVIRRVNP